MARLRLRLWPRSLQGQLLLAIALALLLAQGISAALLYRAQAERREAALVHTAALRLFGAAREEGLVDGRFRHDGQRMIPGGERRLHVDSDTRAPAIAPDARYDHAGAELREIMQEQGLVIG